MRPANDCLKLARTRRRRRTTARLATAAATAGFGALAEDVLARAQYAPSEADDAARARWAKAFVDAGCPSAHHAAALVESNAGDRRYGEVGFWTSALILRAARAPSTARIADLGSGVGRFTLAAALLMPEARVVGVEIAPELHAVAAKVSVPNLSHRNGIFWMTTSAGRPTSSSPTLPRSRQELIADVERKCASLKRGAVVVTLTTRLDAPELDLVELRRAGVVGRRDVFLASAGLIVLLRLPTRRWRGCARRLRRRIELESKARGEILARGRSVRPLLLDTSHHRFAP